MANNDIASVCVVGAGSMGVVTGYHLDLAGAAVTFLVRPHRVEQLSREQSLYCYDDNSLKSYSGFSLLSDPAQLSGKSFDFVVITLDGTALQSESGRTLVKEIGRAYRGTSTGIIIGSMGVDLRRWFIEESGLAEDQVTLGLLGIYAYEAQSISAQMHAGTKPELLARADYAYVHPSPFGFIVDLSAPRVSNGFADLYNRNGVSQCGIFPTNQFAGQMGFFAVLMAMHLLDWPAIGDIDPADETWQLGVDALQEIQRLSVCNPDGPAVDQGFTAEGVLDFFRAAEEQTRPLDMAAFNRYHHGGKVNGQDRDILVELLNRGRAEGAEMPALEELTSRLSRA